MSTIKDELRLFASWLQDRVWQEMDKDFESFVDEYEEVRKELRKPKPDDSRFRTEIKKCVVHDFRIVGHQMNGHKECVNCGLQQDL